MLMTSCFYSLSLLGHLEYSPSVLPDLLSELYDPMWRHCFRILQMMSTQNLLERTPIDSMAIKTRIMYNFMPTILFLYVFIYFI